MALEFTTSCLKDSVDLLRYYKRLGDRAMAQVSDEALFATMDGQSNTIAIIVKHLGGNLRSRWTDFLTSDGEKSDRNRDGEFVLSDDDSRPRLMDGWRQGWERLLTAIEGLSPGDLSRTVTIRGEPHSVAQA